MKQIWMGKEKTKCLSLYSTNFPYLENQTLKDHISLIQTCILENLVELEK